MARPPDRLLSTWMGVAAILIWSSTVAVTRSLSEQVGPLTAGAGAFGLGGILGCAHLVARGRLPAALRLPRAYLAGCGALFVAYIACIFLAVGLAAGRQQTLEVGILNYLWPALILLFSIPLLGARPRALFVPGMVLGLAGAVLAPLRLDEYSTGALRENLARHPAPYLLALAAAVLWALYSNLSRRWAGAQEGGAVPLFVLATGLALAALRGLFPEEARWTARAAAEMAYLALLPTLLAYVLWDAAMRRGDLPLVASLSYGTPLLSTAISAAYLGVPVGWSLGAACGMVVAGALLCRFSLRPAHDG